MYFYLAFDSSKGIILKEIRPHETNILIFLDTLYICNSSGREDIWTQPINRNLSET